jgi:hypothetical protein
MVLCHARWSGLVSLKLRAEMTKITASVLLLAALSGARAQAADIVGAGGYSCGEWTRDHLHHDAVSVSDNAWLAGYLSAYSHYTSDDEVKLPDPGGREGWIGNYCRNNPLHGIYKAADQLILELRPQVPRR